MYGLAEQASALIQAYYNADEEPPAPEGNNEGSIDGDAGAGGENSPSPSNGAVTSPEGVATRSAVTFGSLALAALSSLLLL